MRTPMDDKILQVGDPNLTSLFQTVDPLRGKVPQDQRIDLDKPPKHNGTVTFVAHPTSWPLLPWGFEQMLDTEADLHPEFHAWIQERGIWTLAFSLVTFDELITLETLDNQNILVELAVELYPNAGNKMLGRAHGRPGTYTAGCRGPLCRAANTIAQRARYLGKEPGPERKVLERALMQVRDSYEAYMWYIKAIMAHRRSITSGEKQNRFWSQLSVQDTLLIDCTDESELLHNIAPPV